MQKVLYLRYYRCIGWALPPEPMSIEILIYIFFFVKNVNIVSPNESWDLQIRLIKCKTCIFGSTKKKGKNMPLHLVT